MLYMSIGQNIFIIAMQNSPQHLPVYFILFIDLWVLFMNAEQLDHVKTCLRFIQGEGEYFQSLIVMLCWKDRQVSVENFYDKFGNICGFSFFLLRLLYEEWEDSVEGFYELAWIHDNFLVFAGFRGAALLQLGSGEGSFRLTLGIRLRDLILLLCYHSQYLFNAANNFYISIIINTGHKGAFNKFIPAQFRYNLGIQIQIQISFPQISNFRNKNISYLMIIPQKFLNYKQLFHIPQMAFEQFKSIQDRLMQRNIINHCLKLEYQTFQSMNEDLSFYTLGKYSIFQKIGEGAYGKVHRGLDNMTNIEVAVKVIDIANVQKLKSQRLKEITLRLIKNEDVLMRICDSPNLVKCYDVYQNESLKIMMLQYCNSGDLQHHIEKRKKISEKQSLLIFKQILNGISECHSHKIIHRDLKSENVMIHNGQYKIADFGFSKQLEQDENGGITVLGTITNMAPEVMSRRPYGLKADIWSAGIILFQMVFGEFPFRANDKKIMLTQIEKTNIMTPKRISFNGYTASIEISDFLRRLLAVDYRQRIGWKQLQAHPIFNLVKMDDKVPRYLISGVAIEAPQEEEEILFNDYSNISKLIHQLGEKVMSPSGNIPQPQSRSNRQPISMKSEETKTFEWMRQNLVQCLKVQLIFQEIISKIEGQKMIDFSERASIQLVYLLITRCFLTISPINNKMQQSIQKSKFIGQTYGIIRTLYQKIHQIFLKYSNKLTAEQDKLLNKLSDFFKSKEELVNVDKFFNGIQNKDFQKEEQLRFIQRNYIDPIKNKLKGPEQIREKVRKLLGNYSNINMIQFKHIQQIDFDSYIQRLL